MIAKAQPENIQSLSLFCCLLYSTTEWLASFFGAIAASLTQLNAETLNENYATLLVVNVPLCTMMGLLAVRLIRLVD